MSRLFGLVFLIVAAVCSRAALAIFREQEVYRYKQLHFLTCAIGAAYFVFLGCVFVF
jgi:hypothetical protein